MGPLLSVKNLTVDFQTQEGPVRAVDQVSFDLEPGKTLGIVGESGSGKSVTAFAIMRLIPNPPGKIVGGEILFEGKDLTKLSEYDMLRIRGNDISMIFQEPMTSLNPVFRTGDQVAEVLRIHKGLTRKQSRAMAIDLFDQVGIPDPSNKILSYPHQLSGGQKQRVMIAMAIACEPKLLIADEPTTALDVTIQKQVIDLMFKLQEKYKMGLIFITHDLGVIADIADDVVVMYRSELVEKNNSEKIFMAPQHAYTKGLIACKPGLEENPRRLLTVSDFMDSSGNPKNVNTEKLKPFLKDYSFSDTKNPVLLEVKNLTTTYPVFGGLFGGVVDRVKAVDDVSFKLRRGKTLGLVGESGCGKTTLGRTILKLLEPASGQIIYNGQDITHFNFNQMRPLRKKMQIIFQDPYSSLNPRMTVGDILMEPMIIHSIGSNSKERIERAKSYLHKVGLRQEHFNRYPHEFSGGQRQRICIARALTLEPEFIVCDESVSALDVSIQAQVLNLLLDLKDEMDLTYIFISHDLSVVNFFADHVGVMNQGKIIEMDIAEIVYKKPKQKYTQDLLSAIPRGVPKKGIENSLSL